MKMQFILGLFFYVFLIGFTSGEEVNYIYIEDFSGIQVTQLKYEPYPVNPGEYFDLWIKIDFGSAFKKDATFELLPQFPFSLDANENPIRNFGKSTEEVVIKYKVRVSKDAVEGTNELNYQYSKESNLWVKGYFDIQVENAQTDFDLIIQESSGADYSIAIANIGKNTANSLIIRIPEQENYRVTGTNGQMVGNLDSGDYTIVSFSITQTGRNKGSLEIQLDYTDSIGERRSVIKKVDSLSYSPVNSNNTISATYGNFQRGNFSIQQQEKSILKSYWFWGVIILVLVLIVLAVKYPEKRKYLFSKLNRNKSGSEKNSKGTPEWVLAEKTKRK